MMHRTVPIMSMPTGALHYLAGGYVKQGFR